MTGLDGKNPTEVRDYLYCRSHYLRHAERLSVRQIVARIEEETGIRRSVGSIAANLKDPCVRCSHEGFGTPEHLVGR